MVLGNAHSVRSAAGRMAGWPTCFAEPGSSEKGRTGPGGCGTDNPLPTGETQPFGASNITQRTPRIAPKPQPTPQSLSLLP